MKKHYFIAGTDTGVGKTKVTESLLLTGNKLGVSTLGLKPLAAGADCIDDQWSNEDARALMAASSVKLPYQTVNPVLLKEPMAPHLAAELENRRLSAQSIVGYCRGAFMTSTADLLLIEGAGGWRVPLNATETLADIPKALKLDVILVVGMKLGCLNHALLTAEAIERDGLKIAGWIANCVEPDMSALEGNIHTLQRMLRAPLIGVLPHLVEGEELPSNWINPEFFR